MLRGAGHSNKCRLSSSRSKCVWVRDNRGYNRGIICHSWMESRLPSEVCDDRLLSRGNCSNWGCLSRYISTINLKLSNLMLQIVRIWYFSHKCLRLFKWETMNLKYQYKKIDLTNLTENQMHVATMIGFPLISTDFQGYEYTGMHLKMTNNKLYIRRISINMIRISLYDFKVILTFQSVFKKCVLRLSEDDTVMHRLNSQIRNLRAFFCRNIFDPFTHYEHWNLVIDKSRLFFLPSKANVILGTLWRYK